MRLLHLSQTGAPFSRWSSAGMSFDGCRNVAVMALCSCQTNWAHSLMFLAYHFSEERGRSYKTFQRQITAAQCQRLASVSQKTYYLPRSGFGGRRGGLATSMLGAVAQSVLAHPRLVVFEQGSDRG